MIECESVGVAYGETGVLTDVCLQVPGGAWLALIGPNGAGKTTLLRAVARLVAHTGRIRVDGRPVDRLGRRALARLVGYVPQHPVFPSDMSVADYLMLGRTPHAGYFGGESAEDHRICAGLLDRLELTALAPRRLATLSGGELQRLAVGRALAQQAPVLLLDEPTGALDPGYRVAALELVDDLRREQGLTVLSAIHDLTLAGQFADSLALLAGGRLLATGAPREVLTETQLAPVFGVGIAVLRDGDDLVVVPRRSGRAGRREEIGDEAARAGSRPDGDLTAGIVPD